MSASLKHITLALLGFVEVSRRFNDVAARFEVTFAHDSRIGLSEFIEGLFAL
jgi:hypothetical protein